MSFVQLLAALGAFQETTPPVGAPDPPVSITVTDQSTCPTCGFSGSIKIDWVNGDTEQTRIYRNSVLQYTAGVGVSTWTDTDAALAEDTLYIYEVKHWNGSLESTAKSDSVTSYACLDALTAPTVVASADSDTQITITPSGGGTDVVSYDIHLGDGTYLGNTATTFQHTPLSPGTEYTYKAKARSADGCLSDYGATDSEYTNLAAPTISSVGRTGPNTVEIAMGSFGTGADRYRVFRYGTSTEVGTITNPATPLVDSGLNPATEYRYEVQAENIAGTIGTSTKTASSPTTTMTGTIVITSVTHSVVDCPSASIDLLWSNGDNTVSTIKVERKMPSDGDYVTLAAALTAGTTAYEDTTHDELAGTGTTYYRVTLNCTGAVADTDTVTVDCRPDMPVGADCVEVAGDVTVTWNDASSTPAETGFKIYRAPDVGGLPGTWALQDTVGAGVELWVDSAPPLATYHYAVSSYNTIGESDKDECASNPITVTGEA